MKISKNKKNKINIEFSENQYIITKKGNLLEVKDSIQNELMITGSLQGCCNYFENRKQKFKQVKQVLDFLDLPKGLIIIFNFLMFLFYFPKPIINKQSFFVREQKSKL